MKEAKTFRAYLIEESTAVHPKDAVSYFDYVRNRHASISSALESELTKKWNSIIERNSSLSDKESDDVSDLISFDTAEKIIGKPGHKFLIDMSVTIGSSIDKRKSRVIQKALLLEAKNIFNKYKDRINSGESRNAFIVTQDDDDLSNVRLKFSSGDIVKSIFVCGIDHSMKFTRIYLRNVNS